MLSYDAIMHRVANHRAFVSGARGGSLGVIWYKLATKTVEPLPLAPQPATAAEDQEMVPRSAIFLAGLLLLTGWIAARRRSQFKYSDAE
jgi:hypothetical protein